MSKYQIPESGIKSVSLVLELSQKKFNLFCDFLSNTPSGFTPKSINNEIAQKIGIVETDLEKIFILVFNIYRFKAEYKGKNFLEDFYSSILKSNDVLPEKVKIKDFKDFKERLRKILSIKSALPLTQKAWKLFNSYQRVVEDFRVITDIRPVLGESTDEFNNYLILHQLEIEYTEDKEDKIIYFTLDNNDIKKFKDLINRSEKKYKLLKEKLKASKLNELKIDLYNE